MVLTKSYWKGGMMVLANKTAVLAAVLIAVLTACHRQSEPAEGQVVIPFSEVDSAQVESVLADLTTEEKIGQLLIWQPDFQDSAQRASLFLFAKTDKLSGVFLEKIHLSDYLYAADSLSRCARLPLFFGTHEKVSLHNQFSAGTSFPLPPTIAAVDSMSLDEVLEDHYLRQCKALGINFAFNPSFEMDDPSVPGFDFQTYESDEQAIGIRSKRVEDQLRAHRILAVGDGFSKFEFEPSDSLRDLRLHRLQAHARAGLGGLRVDSVVFQQDTLKGGRPNFVKNYLKNYVNFNGLMVVELGNGLSVEQAIKQGAHLLVTTDAPKSFNTIDSLILVGALSAKELDERVRLVLRAKAWINGGKLPLQLTVMPVDSMRQPVKFVSFSEKRPPRLMPKPRPRPVDMEARVDKVVCYFEDPAWGFFVENIFAKSVILARDEQKIIPFANIYDTDFHVVEYTRRHFRSFDEFFNKYADVKSVQQIPQASGELVPLLEQGFDTSSVTIVLLDSLNLQPGFHKPFIESVNNRSKTSKVVLLNFGNPKNLQYFDPTVGCMQVFERNYVTEAYAAQVLFGGETAEGQLPLAVTASMPFGTAIRNPSVRLGFAPAEATGIANERLVGISAIAETAIDHGVFPGCQVVVAKDGQVIFSQAFGQKTYGSKSMDVTTTDLYDIASVTKVASTTLAAMRLVELGRLDLNATVGDYLRLPEHSQLGTITLKSLLLHQSGLQAQMPLSRFFSGKNVPARGCNDIFCRKRKGSYSVKIAEGLYFKRNLQDTIWKRVYNLPVMAKPRYRYSDVNFFLLQKIIETRSGIRLNNFTFDQVYRPMGLRNITYLPLEQFPKSRVVPTEQDNYWRKTLVQGSVHDPAVALMGGVGGSAGVFSNGEDLAALLQMLLNNGTYGGRQLFDASTVENFTTNKYTNHRGLGFDKPANPRYPTYSSHVSPKSYGHTGFTGTCVWVDPDQKLVYIFLSNRVNPSSRNGKIFTEAVRSRIHEVVYSALGSYVEKLPVLQVEGDNMEEEVMGEGAGG